MNMLSHAGDEVVPWKPWPTIGMTNQRTFNTMTELQWPSNWMPFSKRSSHITLLPSFVRTKIIVWFVVERQYLSIYGEKVVSVYGIMYVSSMLAHLYHIPFGTILSQSSAYMLEQALFFFFHVYVYPSFFLSISTCLHPISLSLPRSYPTTQATNQLNNQPTS